MTGQSENSRRQFFHETGLIARMVQAELDSQDELTRLAARACAIPHYFNQEILSALLGEEILTNQAAQVLEVMRRWDFVRVLNPGSQNPGSPAPRQFTYRNEAREYLLAGLRNTPEFTAYNGRARAYFARQMGSSAPVDESVWLRLNPHQLHAMREMLYHLLQADLIGGYELFRVLFRGAHQWYLPGEAATLLRYVHGMDFAGLPQRYQEELAYFEAVQSNADYDAPSAEARLKDLLTKSIESELRARVLTELGKIYFATDRAPLAAQAFSESRAIWNNLQRPRESAALANNLGNVYLHLRDFRRARGFFQDAINGLRRAGAQGELAQAYNNLGTAYERDEDWKRALEQFETSLQMKNQVGDQFGAARTEVNIATVYHSQIRDVDDERRVNRLRQDALERYQRSLLVFQQMGARSEAATVLYKLSLLYYQSNQADLARQTLPEALEEFRALRIPGLENAEKLAVRLGLDS